MTNMLFKKIKGGAEASVYQYNSLLGSGYLLTLIVLFVQLTVPVLILVYSARQTSRFPAFLNSNNIINDMGHNNGPAPDIYLPLTNLSISTWDLDSTFATNWTIFCDIGVPYVKSLKKKYDNNMVMPLTK